jgi:hypothetical protein
MTNKLPRVHTLTVNAQTRALAIMTPLDISEAYDPSSGDPQPPWHSYRGIWDTGATNTVICERIVKEVGISRTGMGIANTAGGKFSVDRFLVNVRLPSGIAFSGIQVTKGNLGDDIDVLIGMDIITAGDFSITNADGKTCMSFRIPSLKKIDYSEEQRQLQAREAEKHLSGYDKKIADRQRLLEKMQKRNNPQS